MQKILLALQFWNGDRTAAMKVARLIADLQPELSNNADFLFFSRFDTPHDPATVEYVSRKFLTHTFINKRRGVGWPSGCNDLFFGVMDWIYSQSVANKIPKYKAVMLLEGDSCPLHSGWIQQLSAGWDRAATKVYGPLLDHGPHINGNCMMSCDTQFLKWISREVAGCSPVGGWDFLLYQEFKRRGAANSPEMRSWWRINSVAQETYDQLLAQNVSFLHGCKDDSLIRLVRQRHSI